MDIKKRPLTNLVIIAAAVGVTYLIGTLVRAVWSLSV